MSERNISVCIPAFNAEKYIVETLESIVNQTVKPYEIVIVDDCSTDGTLKLLENFKQVCPIPTRIIQNIENLGIGGTRQRLVESAHGNYIAFLSADDCWEPTFIEESQKYIEGHTATYTAYYRCDQYLLTKEVFNPPEYSKQEVLDWALRKNMFINFSCIVFPKWITDTVRFDAELRHGEDLIWLLDSINYVLEWKLINKPLLKYRIHPQQGTHLKTHRQGLEFEQLWNKLMMRLLEAEVPNKTICDAYLTSVKRANPSWVHKTGAKVYHKVKKI